MQKIAVLTLATLVGIALFAAPVRADYIQELFRGNFEQALSEMKPLAEKGDAKAQYDYALVFETGLTVPQNAEEAARWYAKSAAQGYPYAQNNLAAMYQEGRGVAHDERKAVDWFRKAASQGLDKAQYSLGQAYEEGRGVSKDKVQAYAWYSLAAGQGNAYAQAKVKAISKTLTRAQIAKSQKLAAELKPRNAGAK